MTTEQVTRTPGPWRMEEMPTGWEINSDPVDGGHWSAVAQVEVNHQGSRPVTTDEAEANARFIVLACNAHDDLLAACERALECLTMDEEDDLTRCLRAAIRKAEGK